MKTRIQAYPRQCLTCLVLLMMGFLPPFAFAQAYSGECGSCVERKERMCADECELLPAEKIRGCQKKCIADYCSHKCAPNAPELEAYLRERCDDCLEHQFKLCEIHCNVGTPREKAVCQIACSAERCESNCEISKDKNASEEMKAKEISREAARAARTKNEKSADSLPQGIQGSSD